MFAAVELNDNTCYDIAMNVSFDIVIGWTDLGKRWAAAAAVSSEPCKVGVTTTYLSGEAAWEETAHVKAGEFSGFISVFQVFFKFSKTVSTNCII